MTAPGAVALERVEVPCRDLARSRAFYGRVLGLETLEDRAGRVVMALGGLRLALRARGDALFALEGGAGVLLALRVGDDELDLWHRRLRTARAALLDPPAARPEGGRALRLADPDGNVIELVAP